MSTVMDPSSWYTVKQVADILGVTHGRIRQFIVEGRITGKKFGPAWAISAQEVARFKKIERKRGQPGHKKNS